ncbi:hypothetical protein V2W45_1251993, partial [Cenococcum geophilum]
ILTQKHELFNGDRANARVVIISTYSTIISRYGPSALKKWCEKTYRAMFKARGLIYQPVN